MHIVIIGNGISGITAARTIRKLSDHKITVISSESEYFFSRTALMYVYMGHMRIEDIQPYEPWFWKKNRIELVFAHVENIDTIRKSLKLNNGSGITYDKLIIATGSKAKLYQWPGQELAGVHSLYSLQDLQAIEQKSSEISHAVIVGGGLIGIEMAEMFHSRHIPVTMLVRETNFCEHILPEEEAKMVNREIRRHGINLRLESELDAVLGEKHVHAVRTKSGDEIACEFVGLTTGVTPNIALCAGTEIACDTGILVDEYLQTNVQDVYAIGDCAEMRAPGPGRKSIEPVWYAGRIMGETVGYNVCGYRIEYVPGIWFNSAKFFEIEWQVYGDVMESSADAESVYWEHPDGTKSIRINFNNMSCAVSGFNLMGIRYRQEVCEKWIRQNTHITEVLENLSLANFDAEFSRQHEAEIVRAYNARFGGSVVLKQSRSANAVMRFLNA